MPKKKYKRKTTASGNAAALRKRVGELEKSVLHMTLLINKLKAADTNLKEERNLLQTLIDNMPDYIFIKDKESRFVINNKAHLEVLGARSQSEVAGKTDFDVFPAALAARYFSDEQIVLQMGKPVVNREEPVTKPDGTEQWLSTTKVCLKDPGGEIAGLVGISRDITERKRFEKALQAAKDELEVRVAERTLDLKNSNELLATRISQLNFLNTTSYRLSQLLQVNGLGPEIIKSFIARFPRSEAALFVRNRGKFDVLGATAGFSDPQVELSARSALGFLGEKELAHPMAINDWRTNEHIACLSWPGMEHLTFYMTIPLLADNRCIAVIQIFASTDYAASYEAELPLLSTLAAHAASCLGNALNYQELDKSARQQGELSAARTIQQRFSLFRTPSIPRLRLKSMYLPAYEVGGDYLDCFQTEKGDLIVVIADVCGKGMPAALFMVMLRSAFRMLGRSAQSAKDLVCAVNKEMSGNLSEKMFVTVLCLVIEKDGTAMTCARAGHPSLLWQSCAGQEVRSLKSNGLALGLAPDLTMFCSSLEERAVPLEKGNRFFIYTDGLTDANDPEMGMYGIKRLTDLLTGDTSSSPETLVKKIYGDVKAFSQGSPAGDDLTMLAMDVV